MILLIPLASHKSRSSQKIAEKKKNPYLHYKDMQEHELSLVKQHAGKPQESQIQKARS